MDVSTAYDISYSELLPSRFNLNHSPVNHKQCSGIMSHPSESIVVELRDALTGILRVEDVQVESSDQSSVSDGDRICHPERVLLSNELKDYQTKHLNVPTQENLNECATSLCSRKEESCIVSVDENNEIPNTPLHGESSTKSNNSVCTSSISLPTPFKLVSAMKGSREKHGIPGKKLTVTWAPDVYEPSTTPLLPTLKTPNHRPRYSKKNSNQKHKGKSSRESNSEKQYRKHVGSKNYRSKSFSTCDIMFSGAFNHSSVDNLFEVLADL